MIALMESSINSERFIISAENRTYKEIFSLIAKSFGKRQASKEVTPFIASVVWRLEALKSRFTGSEPLVTKETAVSALTKVYYDNSKLKKFLPDFSYHSIEETIAYTCAALQQKLNKF